MAARDRDEIGTGAMEIAFDVSPFAISGFRNSQPLQTAMIAMSILAMAVAFSIFTLRRTARSTSSSALFEATKWRF
jgi:mannose/fructose/N-acetylgalactosamine-specific phosphotransferase system component IIC